MKQRRAIRSSASKTYARVFRGGAVAVTEAVRRETGEGLLLPCGPFRYPYSAIVELLRQAALFHEPTGETATDPVLSREGLTPALRVLVVRECAIGVPLLGELDTCSRVLLRDFASFAEMRRRHGMPAPSLVLGTTPDTDASDFALAPEDVDAADCDRDPSSQASEVLRVLASAPHPPRESELRKAARVSWDALGDALRALVATGHAMVGERVGLGPCARGTVATDGTEWLSTQEVSLPHARLGAVLSGEQELGVHLATAALERGDALGAASCFEACGALLSPEYALALAMLGKREPARAILKSCEEAPPEIAAMAALHDACESAVAETCLRRMEKTGNRTRARALRARLMLKRGETDKSWNLLRRTSRAALEVESVDTQRLHWLTFARCALGRYDVNAVRRALDHANGLLRTEGQRWEWLELSEQANQRFGTPGRAREQLLWMMLESLNADEFTERAADLHPQDVRVYLQSMDAQESDPEPTPSFTSPADAWSWLAGQGASLLALRIGDRCAVFPPGGAARPGLQARLSESLDRLVANPEAVLHSAVEYDSAGPFGGDIVLTLRSLGEFGPALVLFRKGKEAEARRVLKKLKDR